MSHPSGTVATAETAAVGVEQETGRGIELWRYGLVAALGALTCAAAFLNGSYFAGTTGLLAVIVGALAVVWLIAAPDPLAGLTGIGLVGLGALALFAVLELVSSGWSHSAARATLDYDRTLIYVLVFGLFACLPNGGRTLRLLVLAVAPALAVAAIAGWLSRAAPQVIDVAVSRDRDRLSWPTGYWNALGLLCALGLLLATVVVVDRRRHWALRGAMAALIPSLMVTGYFTVSRGAILAVVIGLLPLLIVRGRLAALPVLVPLAAGAVSVIVAYDSGTLVNGPLRPALLERTGHGTVIAVVVGTVVAGLGAGLLARLTEDREPRPPWPRAWKLAVVGVLMIMAAGAAVAARHDISRAWHRASDYTIKSEQSDVRNRLSATSLNGRIQNWSAAIDAFKSRPVLGTGAGTYDLTWFRVRSDRGFVVHDAHSLYLEALGELGIVGFLLIVTALVAGFAALVRRARGPATAVLVGAALAWIVHAGLDWDWEMPAVTMWLWAVLGAATASDTPRTRMSRGSPLRILGAIGLAFLLLTPFNVARSQPALSDALNAFSHRDCPTTIDRALQAAQAANQRPEPFQLLSYCDVRIGRPDLAWKAAQGALRRDPRDWNIRYGAALVAGATGRDPRPLMRSALAANPKQRQIRSALARLDRARTPAGRERIARRLPLLFEGFYKP